MANQTINYWLFQANPRIFRLKDALRTGSLESFAVVNHKENINVGDRVILWESGKEAGCYALGTIASSVSEFQPGSAEVAYFEQELPETARVSLSIEYNLWNRPITKDIIPKDASFEAFYAGLPGTNFQATKQQFEALEKLIQQLDLLAEPAVDYIAEPRKAIPLNQILYGPPGTGKTYLTVNHALSIIEGRTLEELALEDRSLLKARFDEYIAMGRIAFITFHQSFAYEDFIEGIKPRTEKGQLRYLIEPGVFRIMAENARRCLLDALMQANPPEEKQIKFNHLYQSYLAFLKNTEQDIFLGIENRRFFFHKILPFGNIAIRPARNFAVETVRKNQLRKLYDFFVANEGANLSEADIRNLIGKGNPSANWAVFRSLKNFEVNHYIVPETELQEEESPNQEEVASFDLPRATEDVLANCNKYVLIIDEINRGNIPAIFGELISLIEPDKRDGAAEALSTILPYSKALFSVPINLYLLGTMNSVDRSAEAMDIALRRRFAFQALQPEPALLSSTVTTAGIDLGRLLAAMNHRIEVLLDTDHQIGHAYFLNIATLADLKLLFKQTIIPLLQDYFFNDLGKIGLVLGKDFIREKAFFTSEHSTLFANFEHPFKEELMEKRVYELVDIDTLNESNFIRIYDVH